jgi:hypothetical protein
VARPVASPAYLPVEEMAYRQAVSQLRPVEGRGTAAFPSAGLRPCLVVGTVACWGACPGACLAAGRAAYPGACWELWSC